MDVTETLDTLSEENLLEEGETDDVLRIAEEFAGDLDSERARIENMTLSEYIGSLEFDPEEAARFENLSDPDTSLLGTVGALATRTDYDLKGLLTAAVVVRYVEEGMPPTDGSPARFLPVDSACLRTVVPLLDRAFLYVWRDDCEPCQVMREDLDEVFDTHPDDVALISVYGPDCASLLDREFDVPGAPALLSLIRGKVDARMYGPQYASVIERELETLRSVTLS